MAIELSSLNGSNGFALIGEATGDGSGWFVSTGDIDGDGVADLIIGANGAAANGAGSGATYVVFGSTTPFSASISLSTLDGSNGFQINGPAAGAESGFWTSAGDVNDDGVDDVIIGAPGVGAGETHVLFGSTTGFGASVDLSAVNGSNGFRVVGDVSGDRFGAAVSSAGDINGDGVEDLIVGAPSATGSGGAFGGQAYVVFGSTASFGASLDVTALDGSNGFLIDSAAADESLGTSVAGIGDVNGDGIGDVVVGAPDSTAGAAYVVYGSTAPFGASINVSSLDGSNGFKIAGVASSDTTGYAVSNAGDVNGDGIDDLIVGAFGADPNGDSSAGKAYVVFGRSDGFAATVSLSGLNGLNGFAIDGAAPQDEAGIAVSSAGDVDGDGVDDLIVGAFFADPNGSDSGAAYLIYGSTEGFSSSIQLASLDNPVGVALNGFGAGSRAGAAVSGADLNNDGFSDLVVGAFGASSSTGATYVVFGSTGIGVAPATSGDDTLVANGAANVIDGLGGADFINGASGNDTLNGGAGADVVMGGLGVDAIFGGDDTDSLSGGGGGDVITGGSGGDTLFGDDGNDTLEGGSGADSLNGGNGFDIASYGNANAAIRVALWDPLLNTGDAIGDTIQFTTEAIFGTRYADNIQGNSSANNLRGGDGSDLILGGYGNDTLVGGAGADDMGGGAGFDLASYVGGGAVRVALWNPALNTGDAGGDNIRADVEVVEGSLFNDTLEGSSAANNLRGSNGNDQIFGGGGNDILSGDFGADTLNGGAGNDSLIGGGANDTFIFAAGGGSDIIADFLSGSSVIDVIRLDGLGAGFDTFAEVIGAASQQGSDVFLNFGAGQTITLQNVVLADLDADDFAFG